VNITKAALDAIVAHAREALPGECCGLLIGTPARIDSAHPARNLESGTKRFLIDPRDHFAAIHAARESKRFVIGVYHSHPASPATPSAADLADASYDDYVYVIVSLASEPPEARLYRLEEGVFLEEPLTKSEV
jgi:[CysO sulfur-carrier protein]-S-L-cysteine hydrolase